MSGVLAIKYEPPCFALDSIFGNITSPWIPTNVL